MIEYDLVMFLLILHHFGLQTHYDAARRLACFRVLMLPSADAQLRSAGRMTSPDVSEKHSLSASVCR